MIWFVLSVKNYTNKILFKLKPNISLHKLSYLSQSVPVHYMGVPQCFMQQPDRDQHLPLRMCLTLSL